ncbi:MAG: glycosyltransferase family 4 protein [Candidatus Nanopelagicales bacterium]|nr:glycosyltransferase family 4 protein [Candidatus Nanopelagicales bacterium]
MSRDVAFYLKGRPSGGGANSVVQEFTALVHNYGIGYLVIQPEQVTAFRIAYGWNQTILDRVKVALSDLPTDVLPIATTNDSLREIRAALDDESRTILYYVQDYEPLFYSPHTDQHITAHESYSEPNNVVAVVKTDWLRDTLLRETFLPVVKIRPSIDRDLYFPEPLDQQAGRPTLVAMVRPATPRRAPARTVAILNRLAADPNIRADLVTFGCTNEDLEANGYRLDPTIVNAGRLAPERVSELIRRARFVLDVSDYQAFGRTLAEGMASGAIPIATRFGAPSEFIEDRLSGFLVNPSDLDGTYETLEGALSSPVEDLDDMSRQAVRAVAGWSVDGTALDWFALAQDVV